MARSLRIQYPGALYHITARGQNRRPIFRDDIDRQTFLNTLAQACSRTGWRVYAWVLLKDHYHLLIHTPSANLVTGMTWFQNTYTHHFNNRHNTKRRLFGDRYKSIPVQRAPAYIQPILDYIHLNPVRSSLIKPGAPAGIQAYPWSSAATIAAPPAARPEWFAAADLLRAFDLPDTPAARRKWLQRLGRRAASEPRPTCGVTPPPPGADGRASHLRRGWYWGDPTFAAKLQSLSKSKPTRPASQTPIPGEPQARRLLTAALKAASLTPAKLPNLKGSDPRKVAIARVLRARTTVPLSWIAARLHMRTPANVVQQLSRPPAPPTSLPAPLRNWIKSS